MDVDGTTAALAGRFEIDAVLGQGSHGTVYAARQTTTGRQTALKLLRLRRGPRASPVELQIARFEREIDLVAQLRHPNIVGLLDAGRREELLFAAYDFVPGRDLAQILAAEGRLRSPEALHLMGQVLDALGCAHEAGVVHRDIKPENIMITQTGPRRNAVVLDFGIGAVMTDEQRDSPAQAAAGTAAYAAPEQLRGEPATARADLYSWGLVLLECLTGQRAVQGAGMSELLYRQLTDERVSMPAWLRGHPLGELIERVIAKDPGERTASAAIVMRELQAATRGERQAARPRQAEVAERRLTLLGAVLRDVDVDRFGARLELLALANHFDAQLVATLGDRVLFVFGLAAQRGDEAHRALRFARALRASELVPTLGLHAAKVRLHAESTTAYLSSACAYADHAQRALELAVSGADGELAFSDAFVASLDELEPGLLTRHASRSPGTLGSWSSSFALVEVLDVVSERLASAPPLIGSEREVQQLRSCWKRARAGHGGVVVVTATRDGARRRLALEAAAQLEPGAAVCLALRCSYEARDDRGARFGPILSWLIEEEALRTRRRARPSSGLQRLLLDLGLDADELGPALAWMLQDPCERRGSPEQLETSLDALTVVLLAAAERRPILLLVEDLHFADPGLAALLEILVDEAPSAALWVLCMTAPSFTPTWPADRWLRIDVAES